MQIKNNIYGNKSSTLNINTKGNLKYDNYNENNKGTDRINNYTSLNDSADSKDLYSGNNSRNKPLIKINNN